MKFLKRFVLLVLLLVLILIGVGYLLPDEAHVERDIRIDAPPAAVFPYVNDFRRFSEWSPWPNRAPDVQYSYSGPETGVGARLDWQSDRPEAGRGSYLITRSRPPERVTMRLDLGVQERASAYFDIQPAGDGSHVVWGFEAGFGNNIIDRYFGVLTGFRIGGEYERGLQNLKALVEAQRNE